jgi:NDP-sugar pyrophosphorylase family protein
MIFYSNKLKQKIFSMSPVSPSSLFSLESFLHRELFSHSSYVWDALNAIASYLEKSDLGKKESNVPNGVHLVNAHTIFIGKGCMIEPGSYIEGPCIIGDRTTVRQGSYIRGHVITGTDCVIGHATEVKHSIFLDGAKAAHFNYVGDSILGNNTNLGAGCVCANLRLDRQNITLSVEGSYFDTKRHKLGLILGDNAQMGCNSVANPGTILGRGALCYPCVNVSGFIPEGYVVKGQKNIIEAKK